MKKVIIALQSTLLIAAISINHVSGQQVALSTSKSMNTQSLLVSEAANENSTATIEASVNKRAIKDFAKTYKNKVQPSWGLTTENGFTASFNEAGVKNCVYYNKKGIWVGSFKRYDEPNMNQELRQIIKPVYYDYKINGIAEVSVPGTIVYLIYLQNSKTFKTVRVCDGEMSVIEWFEDGKIMDL